MSVLRAVMTPSKGAFTVSIALHLLQPPEIRFGRADVAARGRDGLLQRIEIGHLRLILRLILIVLLARDRAFGHQILPALRR